MAAPMTSLDIGLPEALPIRSPIAAPPAAAPKRAIKDIVMRVDELGVGGLDGDDRTQLKAFVDKNPKLMPFLMAADARGLGGAAEDHPDLVDEFKRVVEFADAGVEAPSIADAAAKGPMQRSEVTQGVARNDANAKKVKAQEVAQAAEDARLEAKGKQVRARQQKALAKSGIPSMSDYMDFGVAPPSIEMAQSARELGVKDAVASGEGVEGIGSKLGNLGDMLDMGLPEKIDMLRGAAYANRRLAQDYEAGQAIAKDKRGVVQKGKEAIGGLIESAATDPLGTAGNLVYEMLRRPVTTLGTMAIPGGVVPMAGRVATAGRVGARLAAEGATNVLGGALQSGEVDLATNLAIAMPQSAKMIRDLRLSKRLDAPKTFFQAGDQVVPQDLVFVPPGAKVAAAPEPLGPYQPLGPARQEFTRARALEKMDEAANPRQSAEQKAKHQKALADINRLADGMEASNPELAAKLRASAHDEAYRFAHPLGLPPVITPEPRPMLGPNQPLGPDKRLLQEARAASVNELPAGKDPILAGGFSGQQGFDEATRAAELLAQRFDKENPQLAAQIRKAAGPTALALGLPKEGLGKLPMTEQMATRQSEPKATKVKAEQSAELLAQKFDQSNPPLAEAIRNAARTRKAVAESPKVKAAEVSLGKAVEKSVAKATVSEVDPTQAHPTLDIVDAQKALRSPNSAADAAVAETKAAAENLRTVEQTVAKEVAEEQRPLESGAEAPQGDVVETPPALDRIPDVIKEKRAQYLAGWDGETVKVKLDEPEQIRLQQIVREAIPEMADENIVDATSALAKWAGLDKISSKSDVDFIDQKMEGVRLNSTPVGYVSKAVSDMFASIPRTITYFGDAKHLGLDVDASKMERSGATSQITGRPMGETALEGANAAYIERQSLAGSVEPERSALEAISGGSKRIGTLIADALEGTANKMASAKEYRLVAEGTQKAKAILDKFKEYRASVGLPNIGDNYFPRMVEGDKIRKLAKLGTDSDEYKAAQDYWVSQLSSKYERELGRPVSDRALSAFRKEFDEYIARSGEMRSIVDEGETDNNLKPLHMLLAEDAGVAPDAFKSSFGRQRMFEDPPLPPEYYERNAAAVINHYVRSMSREIAEAKMFGKDGRYEGIFQSYLDGVDPASRPYFRQVLRNELSGSIDWAPGTSEAFKNTIKVGENIQGAGRAIVLGAANTMAPINNLLFATFAIPLHAGLTPAAVGFVKSAGMGSWLLAAKAARKIRVNGRQMFKVPEASIERQGAIDMAIMRMAVEGSNDAVVKSKFQQMISGVKSLNALPMAVSQFYVDIAGYYAGKMAFADDLSAALKGKPVAIAKMRRVFGNDWANDLSVLQKSEDAAQKYAIYIRSRASGTGRPIMASVLNNTRAKRALSGLLHIPIEQGYYTSKIAKEEPMRFTKAAVASIVSSTLAASAIYNLSKNSAALQGYFGLSKEDANKKAEEIDKIFKGDVKSTLKMGAKIGVVPTIGAAPYYAAMGASGEYGDDFAGARGMGASLAMKAVPQAIGAAVMGKPYKAVKDLIPGTPKKWFEGAFKQELKREATRPVWKPLLRKGQ